MDSPPIRVFAVWIGGDMPSVRMQSLETFGRIGYPIELVEEQDVAKWLVAGHPLHRSWHHLSAIHKADYLRAYLMHHHGGGYSDIKPVLEPWSRAFSTFADSRVWAAGYREWRWGVATAGLESNRRWSPLEWRWWRWRVLQLSSARLIGNGAYIMRPRTPLTTRWISTVEQRLDGLADALAANPARLPKEVAGMMYQDFTSRYPVPWAHLHGDILHPLCFRYQRHLVRALPRPCLENYE